MIWRKGLHVAADRECPIIGRIVYELEYMPPDDIERHAFALIVDEDDRFKAKRMHLKNMENNLSILPEIEKEKPKLCALSEMNTSERSEAEIK